ncbi:MAG: MFS transporter [Chloroflexota bacterium]|jgi:predicted MFS family arabinose efflux permease|nr:MFS transporter [Chloroflexota bacterium]MDP6509142.1 MFS transporter [Chloroflexota bacterium]MDP6757941.1 MFS transporter [Chloroflexota bacterium]
MPTLLLGMFATILVRSSYGPLPVLIATDLAITVPVVAQLLTVEAALTLAAAIILAPLSDRVGRRRTALIGILSRVIGASLVAVAPNFPVLLLGGAFLGIGFGGLLPQLFGSIVAAYPSASRDRRITAIIMASRIAMVTAPLLSGFLAGQTHWRAAYVVGAAITVLAALAIFRFLPPDHRSDVRSGSFRDVVLVAIVRVLRNRPALFALLGNLFYAFGTYGIESFLGAFVAQVYGLKSEDAGLLLAIGPAFSFAELVIGGRARQSLRLPILIAASLIFAATAAVLLTVRGSPPLMAATYATWAFAAGFRLTWIWSLALDLAPGQRSAVTGLTEVTFAGGTMLGSASGGLALAFGGYSVLGWLLGSATLLSALAFSLATSLSRNRA